MPIEGTLRRDPERGFNYHLRETPRGLEGERNYEVNTDLEHLALHAVGVPRLGEAWGLASAGELACAVISREVFRIGGRDDTGTGTGGLSRVQCLYGPVNVIPGLDGKPWTEVRFGVETMTAKYPHFRTQVASLLDDSGLVVPPPYDQIAGGDGASVELGTLEALVHVYLQPSMMGAYLSRVIALCRPSRVNRYPLVLPRLQGTNAEWAIAAEQARMRAAEVRLPVGGRLEIVLNLALAEDWRTVWQPEDSTGKGVPNVYFKDNVYYSGDFGGLW